MAVGGLLSHLKDEWFGDMRNTCWTLSLFAATLISLRAQEYKAYQNYDFVTGDRVVFEDDFRADRDGEFPAHWKLLRGQAVVNQMQGEPVFALTEGNYVEVAPRITANRYLTNPFTVELDFFAKSGSYDKIGVALHAGDEDRTVWFGPDVSTEGLEHDLTGSYPGGTEAFDDKWHHLALVFKDGQVKCYEDQTRVLVVPEFGTFKPESLSVEGSADQEHPLLLKNVRIAGGGGMDLIDRLTKEGKVVSHGIQFEVNSSRVKPESMGTINAVVKMMSSNPALRLEIGGHTDSTGDAAQNTILSQARAEAVKKLIVDQGIEAARLSAKGYGASKPIDKNDSPEGRANNRRVEFTKI